MWLLPFRFRTPRFPSLLKSFLQILTTLTPSQPLPKQPAGISTTNCSNGFDAPISCRRSRDISSASTNAQGTNVFDVNFVSSGEKGDGTLDVFDALVGIFEVAGLTAAGALVGSVEGEGYEACFCEEFRVQASCLLFYPAKGGD
jgi:hypothetical protein